MAQGRQDSAGASGERWLDYGVWTVALWASFLNLLNFSHYPLFRPEVGLTLVGLAVLGILMAAMHRLAKPRLSFLVAALFTTVAIDLNSSIGVMGFLAIWAGLAIVFFFAERVLFKVTFAAFAAVLLFQLVALTASHGEPPRRENEARRLQTDIPPRSTRPAIVHLLLDSYLGLDGMALGPDEYRDLRAEHVAFFTKHGFQFYPRAYSRYTRTRDSLPSLFSYGEDPPVVHSVDLHYVPEQLPYFSDLDKRGYRISAVLPMFFDLCVNQRMTHCRSWENSGLTSMLGTEVGIFDRAKIFAFTMLRLTSAPTHVAARLQFGANDLLGTDARWPFNRSQLVHLASLKELDPFIDELADIRAGEVRFAHFLIPHSPYGLTASCAVKPEAEWMNEHGPTPEAAREIAYADQVRCLKQHLDRMMGVLNKSREGREAIVVLHGDHGSRIAPTHPHVGGPELSQRQKIMLHSTLFAIRVPGEAPREVPGTHALDELMADFRARDFASAPNPKGAPARVQVMGAPGLQPLTGFGS